MSSLALRAEAAPSSLLVDQLSPANFQRLAKLINSYSGIQMPPTKRTMLEGRLRRRVRAIDVQDLNDYCSLLFDEGGLDAEIVHLIDAVTTNKTEFFREPTHFDYVRNVCLPAFDEAGLGRVKAWSAACSTGAEPYTLAMVLEEHRRATKTHQDYSILCTDLSSQVLEAAVTGAYSEAMIEPVEFDLRRRYLLRSKTPGRREVRIVPTLRSKLKFARLNLMDETYPVDRDMSLIFCRNILIYFNKETQAQVLTRLCDHLRPGGYLFLGHSESVAGVKLPVTQVSNTVFQRR